MHGLSHLGDRHPEVPAHDRGERGRLAAPVLPARREVERLAAEHLTAAPVARLPAERRIACGAPVRRAPDDVDPGAAHDGDRVARVGARAQQRERVVVDGRRTHPRLPFDGRGELGDVGRNVSAAEEERAVIGDAVAARTLEQPAEDRGAAVRADAVRVAARAAHVRERLAVDGRDDEVGLGVAAVGADDDHAHGRNARFASISLSASFSATSAWPTSGCASSARKTRSRPPRSAASSASSS